jgi:uncharacterized protein (TIGR03083 family)
MSNTGAWLSAVRDSHDRLAALVSGLDAGDAGEVERPSACSEWTVAQVLSHLGSQAEIFSLFVDAGLTGGEPPSQEAFGPIWEAWNARSPHDQATGSVDANEAFVSRLESLDTDRLEGFGVELFGRQLDASGLLRMRLSEHAVHTWDVDVVFDPSAEVAAAPVELLVDGLGETAARSARPLNEAFEATIITTRPTRRFTLINGDDVRLEPANSNTDVAVSVEMPAAALLRLVYGRLNDEHPSQPPVHTEGVSLRDLQSIFPGF